MHAFLTNSALLANYWQSTSQTIIDFTLIPISASCVYGLDRTGIIARIERKQKNAATYAMAR